MGATDTLRRAGFVPYWGRPNGPHMAYCLIRRDVVVYVGQAVNLGVRLNDHRNKGKVFDCAWYLRVPSRQLNAVESALIRFFRPEYNCAEHTSGDLNHIDHAILGAIGLYSCPPTESEIGLDTLRTTEPAS